MRPKFNLFLRISAFVCAIFMLVLSTGVSISIHYCNGNVIDVAVNKRAEACKGASLVQTNSTYGCAFSRKSCCEDADWLLVVDNEVPPNEYSGSVLQLAIIPVLSAPFSVCYSHHQIGADGLANAPPLRQTDFQALFQVFLI